MLDAECVVQESRERLVRADQLRAVFKSGHFGLQQGGYCVGIDQDTLLVFLTSALPSGALVSGLPPACSTPCSGSDLKAGVWRNSALRHHAQFPGPRGQRHRGGAIPRPRRIALRPTEVAPRPPQREAGQTEQDGPPIYNGCDPVHCRLLEDDVGDLGGGVFLLGIAHLVLTGVKADAGGAEGG